jgi:uncharacterized membrane protein
MMANMNDCSSSEFINLGDRLVSAVSGDGTTIVGSPAFRWTRAEGITPLPTIPDAETQGATGVSFDGSAVAGTFFGQKPTGENLYEAYRWTAETGIERLGVPPGFPDSRAVDVSADGETVLAFSFPPSGQRTWIWTAPTGFRTIGVPSGTQDVMPSAISSDGEVVVGQVHRLAAPVGDHAFRWTRQDGFEILPRPQSASYMVASDVSSDGSAVVGSWRGPGWHAYRRTEGSGVSDLGTLQGFPAHDESFGDVISADGMVALGRSRISDEGVSSTRAFVWDAVHGMRDLETVLREDHGMAELHPWGLTQPRDISADRRTIVGTSTHFQEGADPRESWVIFLDEPLGPPLPANGDYNANGSVEQADLDLVLLSWGNDASAAEYPWINDLPTGLIDQDELDAVLVHWGASGTISGPRAAAVPEPAVMQLSLVCVAGMAVMGRSLHRRIASDPRNAIEVGVVAGKVDETVMLHDGGQQGVVGQKSDLLAHRRPYIPQRCGQQNDLDSIPRHLAQGLTEASQRLHTRRIPLESVGDSRKWPAERRTCLQCHEPMRHLGEHVSRREARQFLVFNPLQELRARRAELRMGLEVINERIGVQEDSFARGNTGKDHCGVGSGKSSSGSIANRSASSASPVQPISPAVCRARLESARTVIRTLSCSANGSGSAGFRTPSSYVASIDSSIAGFRLAD